MTAKYRLLERCFLKADDSHEAWIHEAGAIVEYSGIPHRNFVPLNAEAASAMAFAPLSTESKNVLPRRGDQNSPLPLQQGSLP
jgi:hypothetical protein